MIKKPFFSLTPPRFHYDLLTDTSLSPRVIAPPSRLTWLVAQPYITSDCAVAVGDTVHCGQKIQLYADKPGYVVATDSGAIAEISAYPGDFGRSFTAITIETASDQCDAPPEATLLPEALDTANLATAADYLTTLPGAPPFADMAAATVAPDTLIVFGGHGDLLMSTNQFIINRQLKTVTDGIAVLRQLTGIDRVIIIVPRELFQGYGHIDAEIKPVDTVYPAGHPHMIMDQVLGRPVPIGETPQSLGVWFFSAEAVAALGRISQTGKLPTDKLITLVGKDGVKHLCQVRIGAPVGHICRVAGIELLDQDRIIIGGPLTGSSIFSETHPITPDTDAVIIQGHDQFTRYSDYPCINCGECVRACPARVPVNMLVRFLEAGLYQDAADQYDLMACIDCGLCSVVCVSHIPIFQYIKLAKHELSRTATVEVANEPE